MGNLWHQRRGFAVLAGFFMGLMQRHNFASQWQLFIAVGLWADSPHFQRFPPSPSALLRRSNVLGFAVYVFGSNALGIAGAALGYWLTKPAAAI